MVNRYLHAQDQARNLGINRIISRKLISMVSDHLVTVINLNCIHTLITLINTILICDNLMSTVLHKESRVDKEDGEDKEEKEDREDKEDKEGTEHKED